MKSKDLEPWAKIWMYITVGVGLSMLIPHWRGVIIMILIPALFFIAWVLFDYLKKWNKTRKENKIPDVKESKRQYINTGMLVERNTLPPKRIAYVLLGIIVISGLLYLSLTYVSP